MWFEVINTVIAAASLGLACMPLLKKNLLDPLITNQLLAQEVEAVIPNKFPMNVNLIRTERRQ
ncbi:hypothetical protein [uncultured Tateyamaria sp.]|uniref:hypothetical protein n=1 Tax=uncultured Tateyamaria sp. TaxID=455651 RepID=UPI002636A55F|nr:hypothetical protein [uncultured Tateyamaria sp.]